MVFNINYFLLLFLALTFVSSDFLKPTKHLPYFSDYPFDQSLSPNNSDWMSRLSDSVNITSLSIPGTHDTCTYGFKGKSGILKVLIEQFGRTQTWTLEDQLKAGLRYVDIRASSDGRIYHGILRTTSTLLSVMETVAKFLKEHPTEGIVMRLSFSQNKKCPTSECVEKNFMNVLNRHSDILYVNDTIPVMKDIRGKVFLITGGITYKSEFKWGSRITLQDDYQFIGDGDKAIAHKTEEVQEYMDKSKDKSLFIINHCSAAGAYSLVSLKRIAYEVNQVPYNGKEFGGIIPLDFPGEELVTHIIEQNFIN